MVATHGARLRQSLSTSALYGKERGGRSPNHHSPAKEAEAVPVSESLSVRLCLCLPTLLGVVPNAHAETLNPMNGVVLDDIDNRKATIGSVVTEMMAICSPTFQQRLMTMKRRNPWLAILATLVLVMPGCALKPEKQSSRFGYVPHSKQSPGRDCNCHSCQQSAQAKAAHAEIGQPEFVEARCPVDHISGSGCSACETQDQSLNLFPFRDQPVDRGYYQPSGSGSANKLAAPQRSAPTNPPETLPQIPALKAPVAAPAKSSQLPTRLTAPTPNPPAPAPGKIIESPGTGAPSSAPPLPSLDSPSEGLGATLPKAGKGFVPIEPFSNTKSRIETTTPVQNKDFRAGRLKRPTFGSTTDAMATNFTGPHTKPTLTNVVKNSKNLAAVTELDPEFVKKIGHDLKLGKQFQPSPPVVTVKPVAPTPKLPVFGPEPAPQAAATPSTPQFPTPPVPTPLVPTDPVSPAVTKKITGKLVRPIEEPNRSPRKIEDGVERLKLSAKPVHIVKASRPVEDVTRAVRSQIPSIPASIKGTPLNSLRPQRMRQASVPVPARAPQPLAVAEGKTISEAPLQVQAQPMPEIRRKSIRLKAIPPTSYAPGVKAKIRIQDLQKGRVPAVAPKTDAIEIQPLDQDLKDRFTAMSQSQFKLQGVVNQQQQKVEEKTKLAIETWHELSARTAAEQISSENSPPWRR